jgi:hypothetical protein
MSNRARIWASWEGNRGFWPVFAMNKYLSTKPKANPLGLKPILDIFLKPQKNYVQHCPFQPSKNMSLTIMKYRFSHFRREQTFVDKFER